MLFRKEAVDRFSSSSEQHRSVNALSIKAVIFVCMLVICTAVFSFWLFFGSVLETVTVEGIIWPSENKGSVYSDVVGSVTRVVVNEGDVVKAGDMIAVIPQNNILDDIKEAKAQGASEERISDLYEQYDRSSIIRSHLDGIVTYVVDENSRVIAGNMLAQITPYSESGNNKILTAFIPSKKAGLIQVGMEVQITPDFVARDEYGYINGYVSDISQYPQRGQQIKESNDVLFITGLSENESYIRIEITLLPDGDNASNLSWSRPESGDINVAMGTICTADIIIEKCRPFEWLF